MKVWGDIERVNLSTGERWQRVVGNGESLLVRVPESAHCPHLNVEDGKCPKCGDQ